MGSINLGRRLALNINTHCSTNWHIFYIWIMQNNRLAITLKPTALVSLTDIVASLSKIK